MKKQVISTKAFTSELLYACCMRDVIEELLRLMSGSEICLSHRSTVGKYREAVGKISSKVGPRT